MWDGMQTKTVVAVNMTFVHTHCRRVSANAAYAINNNSQDHIVIVMHDFDDACKDWTQVSAFACGAYVQKSSFAILNNV